MTHVAHYGTCVHFLDGGCGGACIYMLHSMSHENLNDADKNAFTFSVYVPGNYPQLRTRCILRLLSSHFQSLGEN